MDIEDQRQEAEERIRLFPGCEGIRVAGAQGEWRALMTAPGEGDDVLVRRATLPLLVDFFERHGGYGRET